jgi:hypothetical protein
MLKNIKILEEINKGNKETHSSEVRHILTRSHILKVLVNQ